MGWQSLICIVLVATQAAFAFSGAEHRSGTVGKVNYDSVEDVLADALVDEIKSAVSSDSESIKDTLISDIQTAASQIQEGYWLESDRRSSSLDDENDALHSRDYSNSNKRDEYYEGLEKKAQRSTYIPPPRKTFYAPPEIIDVSASIEEPIMRAAQLADDDDYYPKIEVFPDILPAGSQHRADSLDVNPSEKMFKPRQVQTPPWRFTKARAFPKLESPVVPEQSTSSEPLIPRAAVMRSHGTYKMMSSPPKRPPTKFVPKTHHSDAPKFRSLSQAKPFATEYSKAPYSPKLAQQEERMFQSSFPSVGGYGKKGTRQQFHEQGVHGPDSYKFGYNTGDVENPMARYEERDADGVVRGSYSYIDPRGHKQVVHYESHPKFGFSAKQNSNF